MFRDTNYGDQHMSEDPELMNDGDAQISDFEAFGPITNIENKPNTVADQLAEVQAAYEELSPKLDLESKSIIDRVLGFVENNFWIHNRQSVRILAKLMLDVLLPFKNDQKQIAQDNLLDLDSEVKMLMA